MNNAIIMNDVRVRRRDRRLYFAGLLVFVAVFLFTVLHNVSRVNEEDAEAASLKNFDAGYIISDYQMGNYKSMTEKEIQTFLTSKNACTNTSYEDYQKLTKNQPNYTWHFENGHFVCLSEELFGDGEVIGKGETAAHIIYKAAQDYKINPQVLIVLLQKETGLITDPIPNNGDYRKATGYGCPDSAPCSSEYYGFKNQVRKAAQMFRTVLDGGWTNYPLGNNYIQYNPSKACGGSTVNIRSLATSALYRYTPYQPNTSAIAAGYGSGDSCGAYGNRNFYLYFSDWFGDPVKLEPLAGKFENMTTPRILYVKKGARYVDPKTGMMGERTFGDFTYFASLAYQGESLCLAMAADRNCYLYSDLAEIKAKDDGEMAVKRMLISKKEANYFDFVNGKWGKTIKKGEKLIFTNKFYINNQLCLQTKEMATAGQKQCVLYDELEEIPAVSYSKMVNPRKLYVKGGAEEINTATGIGQVSKNVGKSVQFEKLTYWFGKLCLQVKNATGTCILYDDLAEIEEATVSNMVQPRFFKVKSGAKIINPETGLTVSEYTGRQIEFFDKLTYRSGKLCLIASGVTGFSQSNCVFYEELEEIDNFTAMAIPRDIEVTAGAKYFDVATGKATETVESGERYFTERMMVNGKLCLQTGEDAQNHEYRCVMYADYLRE